MFTVSVVVPQLLALERDRWQQVAQSGLLLVKVCAKSMGVA